MTPSEILMKHEDANEYHFHEVDRKWIIEAMEEYATISKMETTQITMAQQTAVEWFWIHLPENISKEYFDLFEQAKQMEKEQIIRTCLHTSGRFFDTKSWIDILNNEIKKAEQYYNETYNK